ELLQRDVQKVVGVRTRERQTRQRHAELIKRRLKNQRWHAQNAGREWAGATMPVLGVVAAVFDFGVVPERAPDPLVRGILSPRSADVSPARAKELAKTHRSRPRLFDAQDFERGHAAGRGNLSGLTRPLAKQGA